MNAELYTKYCKYIDSNVSRIAAQFQLPVYELEEAFFNAFPKINAGFNPEKSCLWTYVNKIFWNTAIDVSKRRFIYGGDETNCKSTFNQERQLLLADIISNLSEASNFIVNAILSGEIKIGGIKRHGGKEKCIIKRWLLEKKGWTAGKINACFLEIQQALQEVSA